MYNAKIIKSTNNAPEKSCNCCIKPNCPLVGSCLSRSIVYQASVSSQNHEEKTYIGMTEGEFKTRFHNHEQWLRNKKYAWSTALSKYIWELKEKDINYNSIKWSILKRTSAYKSGVKHCNLCLHG